MTTVLDDAISTYRAAAILLEKVTQARACLVDSVYRTDRQQVTLFEGHHGFSDDFEICVPSGSRATLTMNHQRSDGATIESDLPEWMTLEGWLPASSAEASVCFVELEIDVDEPVTADAFVREINAEFGFNDSPATILRLGTEGLTVLRMDLSPMGDGSRRKVIVQLRHPPASFKLRGFSLIPL